MNAVINKESFGCLTDGTQVNLYTLTNKQGMCAKITNFGGIIVALHVPDKNGKLDDVVLGFDSVTPYETDSPYFGALIGRFGNRIADARFELDGKTYPLEQNDNSNCLHGGHKGFDKVVWDANVREMDGAQALVLNYLSPNGEGGFPGNLDITVVYWLTDDNELITSYRATTDQATPVNLTQHSYFNLAGSGDVLAHELHINAEQYLPVNETLIPFGLKESVQYSAFDFRTAKAIGRDIERDNDQLQVVGGGYDHNFIIDKKASKSFELAATVVEPQSGRVLEVFTTEPGVQLYSGNFLDGTLKGKGGQRYTKHGAFCLEPQHFPDSPNQNQFPSTILRPDDAYQSRMSFKFSIQN